VQSQRLVVATAAVVIILVSTVAIVPRFQAKPIFTIRMRGYENDKYETYAQLLIWDDGSYYSRCVDSESDFFPVEMSEGQLSASELKSLKKFIKSQGDAATAKEFAWNPEVRRQYVPDEVMSVVMHYWFKPLASN
jgi:hypothetical protein